jgi:hypothetical protein
VARGVERFDLDGERLVEQNSVRDDLGLQAGSSEARSDVEGRGIVLGAALR